MSAPIDYQVKFWLDDDGRHVWFQHHCTARESWKPTPDPDGGPPYEWNPCSAMLPLYADGWTLVSADPITVTPSVQCGACGCHGYITNGEWVSC